MWLFPENTALASGVNKKAHFPAVLGKCAANGAQPFFFLAAEKSGRWSGATVTPLTRGFRP